MDFLSKAIFLFLFVYLHLTSGYVRDRHEITRRDVNLTVVDEKLGGALSAIFGPIADLADNADFEIPVISHFRTKKN
ncbi:uncharacterized protein LOC108089545 [Drosophila ficusphila]|uniref:uncharacterized protein LOC108089545 n=1 Tax=Drosophila ficusphila TaxID=30025 RepID=UPI0007E84EDA|nr:uncharacterized protein LOC108089545 [Drosophila ficusphila]